MFLGGLSPDTTKQDILDVVEQYGKVMDVQIMTEKNTNKPRGFGFAILDDFDDVDKLCIKKYHRIKVIRSGYVVFVVSVFSVHPLVEYKFANLFV